MFGTEAHETALDATDVPIGAVLWRQVFFQTLEAWGGPLFCGQAVIVNRRSNFFWMPIRGPAPMPIDSRDDEFWHEAQRELKAGTGINANAGIKGVDGTNTTDEKSDTFLE